ncbi:protein of unknown function (DU1801) [Mucilaginibacter mallensis]|uniref:YdhG-like domain-containing protein n=1 Tax=Mucilaginibacter mallensis TaxID=652787 RepID=A0A1H1W2L4_MUCMA|nr:DUF1801 domain-containing protein [Mucilaginibacter mallensis]SDS90459.1 protein of unknown function (DU1801) [Mucilaginibacter mallensis]
MAKNKTFETEGSVIDFINSIADETKRADSFRIAEIMEQQSGYPAKMWGPAIIGFGSCHYKYESGREGDMPMIAFSPRKAAITLYLSIDFPAKEKLLEKFGKHDTGKGCIYLKRLSDINLDVLNEMIAASIVHTKSR